MMNINTQVKSRERVAAYGEVFTRHEEVSDMCDLVKEECKNYKSTFLEPACGDGNFLAEILTRKLDALENDSDFHRKSLIALASLYGIDILPDNVTACRTRLYDLWDKRRNFDAALRTRAREIVNANIVEGDTLKPGTITFTEWIFPEGSTTPRKKFFRLSEEVDGQYELPL